MKNADYDNPVVEQTWCSERFEQVKEYLSRENVKHGQIADWPAWHVAPYVSIWAIESAAHPNKLGWWVICGDLPTDYVSASELTDPTEALRAIVSRWSELSDYLIRGEEHPTIRLGEKYSWSELGPLLKSRTELLAKWVDDDSLWDPSI